jgi:hypothetical protein
MAKRKATTVKDYMESLPDDRRKVIAKVRSVIRKHLPKGYEEKLNFGVISYQIPLKALPDTYNGQPLCYAGLAAQKNHNALYLMSAYGSAKHRAALEDAFKKAGKKLDMGKSCVRFRDVDDLPLPAIGKLIASVPAGKYIESYRASRVRK